jgi:DNA-binding CsgD family transcriptional regulator/tetratricopeptide (TPR) repeat protein
MATTELLEREEERTALAGALEASRAGGRIVLVAGEAGIGKTSLVAATCRETPRRRVLWGACDPLVTPRALGPVWDVARDAGGPLLELLERGASREALLGALLAELDERGAATLVVEDLHWADDATLDLLALAARRLPRRHGCLVLTCRTDALGERPAVRTVLAALPREATIRVELEPLSPAAVDALARPAGRDGAAVHALTGGNPFLVTEALSAPGDRAVPASVRDAMAQRLAALDPPAREAAEVAAVVPGQVELALAETLGLRPEAVEACLAAGILEARGPALAYRHELARRAVEDELSPVRHRELDLRVLAALEAQGADPARLAHHARRAGDVDAIRRLAPRAAQAAASAGGHGDALEHWEAALAAGGTPEEVERALEGVATEAYLGGRSERALEARRALLARHEAAGDALRVGDELRRLSRALWWAGRGEEADAAAERAVAVLEAFPDSRELAMAISGRSQLAMLSQRHREAIDLGLRAVALGRALGDDAIVCHALTNVGTAMMDRPDPLPARGILEEAHVIAVDAGLDDDACRAIVNLAWMTLMWRRDAEGARADIERALAFARERELEGYVQYLLGARAHLRMLVGEWAAAEADAHASLELEHQPGPRPCPGLIVLGRLDARRGGTEAGSFLDRAWARSVDTGELQRLGPAAAARAEHAWLEDDPAGVLDAVGDVYDLAVARRDPWQMGELAYWRWRAGVRDPAQEGTPAPYARSIAGDPRGAAEAWTALGFPYEAADALADSPDEADAIEALRTFDRLGAARSAARLRRRLRAAGLRRIPRGPRAASREAPAGLTPRQLEVLALLAEGATNAEIAERLVISPKTVDHHVSAVLAKLGVASRREAAQAAQRWGAPPDVERAGRA